MGALHAAVGKVAKMIAKALDTFMRLADRAFCGGMNEACPGSGSAEDAEANPLCFDHDESLAMGQALKPIAEVHGSKVVALHFSDQLVESHLQWPSVLTA